MMRLLGAVLICSLLSLQVVARESVTGMSQRVFKAIGSAQELIDAGDYAGARGSLEGILETRLTNYERAHILNLSGYSYYEEDRLNQARSRYEEALLLSRLPDSMITNLLMTLGQVCLVQEDYLAAEHNLLRLLAMPDQDTPGNEVLLAAALMGQERYRDALQPLQRAIDARDRDDDQPKENWLSMLASVHYELGDFRAMREVVARLARLYPQEQYLMNLAALHGELGDTGRQLALVQSLADYGRVQQEVHLKMLANLFMSEDLPHKAAMLLQRELEDGRIEENVTVLELLSQAWYSAAEPARALPPLERAAAMSGDGRLYLRLARLYMDAHQWKGADRAARMAVERGGLRQEGHAWILRGMARVRMKQLTEATEFFDRARDFEESERYAEQ